MNHMKKIFTLFVFIALPLTLLAQQPFQFSQYFQNAITFNPAIAGTEEFLDLKVGYRQQWSGIEGAPETYFISAHSALSKEETGFPYQNNSLRISDPNLYTRFQNEGGSRKLNPFHHGLGGYIVSDHQGRFAQQLAFVSYAFHWAVANKLTLSLGISGGLNSRMIDLSGINLGDEVADNVLEAYRSQQGRVTDLDFNAGLFLYGDKFYVGYSATRLLQNPLYATANISGQQHLNHYGMAGLIVGLNSNIVMLPGLFLRYNGIEPMLYDVNLRFKFNNLIWVGASYRNTQTLAGMAGININSFINVNYSYDYGISQMSDFSSNVHEIVLGFMLFNKKDTSPYLW